MSSIPWAAIIPIAVVALGFVTYCVRDVLSQSTTRYLPKWAWVLVCVASVPLGGIVYLAIGHEADAPLSDADL